MINPAVLSELTAEQIGKLSTHRLLNLYRKVRNSTFGSSYSLDYATAEELAQHQTTCNYADRLKAALDQREHVHGSDHVNHNTRDRELRRGRI